MPAIRAKKDAYWSYAALREIKNSLSLFDRLAALLTLCNLLISLEGERLLFFMKPYANSCREDILKGRSLNLNIF